MSEWFETADGILARVWGTLGQGVADAKHPARLPTFATVSPDGLPEARTVVLRSADRETMVVTVHTDLYSDKIKSLRATPHAALHIWDAKQDLQIRLQAEVSIGSGAGTRALWNKIPDHAQQSYGVTPPPGAPIKGALEYVKNPDPATFAVLHCTVTTIDAVHLGADHRRVSFSRIGHWQGQWLSP
ncbi:pyridoxamine 5'-phosphate oxidase-like protein [Yoonia maricola]|uniref:Pyridoxamine 5'-phosphate oxidase-like protein n=1 Tax=Yoonia maricola TaxID=420999 RepID=A0A2M8WQA4_9RHOB|nr:pyridoxamine 5'-phosphate oxidase family protein [Yoonia maricola]PJI93110.1 pyridoxamine 5'-phosphate oxidase-like protein [Yoonia maricola]